MLLSSTSEFIGSARPISLFFEPVGMKDGQKTINADEDSNFPFWRSNVAVLAGSNFLTALCFAMAWPFLPLMVRDLGVTSNLETWVGTLVLVFNMIGFFISPVWGAIADHYGRKLMVLRATLGMGFLMLLLPLAPSPSVFAAVFLLVGIFNGSTPAANSLIVSSTPKSQLGRALSVAQSGYLLGRTLGPAIAAAIAIYLAQYSSIFTISGALLLVAGILVIAFVREKKFNPTGRWRLNWFGDLKSLMALPRIPILMFLSFIFSVLWAGNVTIMSLFMLELLAQEPPPYGNEAAWIGAPAVALALSSLVVLPFWGRMIDSRRPEVILTITISFAVLTHVALLFVRTPIELVLARIAFGAGAVAMQPTITRLLKEYAPEGMDARAISWATSFHLAATGIAPFIAGIVGPQLGWRTYFAFAVLLTAIGLFTWLFANKGTRVKR